MIGEYNFIPNGAFLYFPSDDQIQEARKNKKQRIIFCGALEYDPEEKQNINAFRMHIEGTSMNTFILDFSDDVLLRFLQATSFRHDECTKALVEYHKWQLKTLPLQISSKIQDLLKEGILYVSGRDYCFRPIIVVNVGRVLQLKIKETELKEVLGYFFQFMIENFLIQGQVQTWISIIDLNNQSIFSLGGALMNIISFLSSIFRARVCHSYLLRCPSSMKMLWSMIKKVLNEDQIRKLTFSEKKHLKAQAFQKINPKQIEKKYGGELENIEQYWPITINQGPYQTEEWKPQLIDQSEYNLLFEEGKLRDRKIKKGLLKQFKNQKQAEVEEDKITEKEEQIEELDEMHFPREKEPVKLELNLPSPFYFDEK